MNEELLPVMEQVYSMAYQREILKQSVANDKKLFSIYEQHADIISKGSREVLFGHKINLATSKSNLILDCEVFRGNPSAKILDQPTLERIASNYG